MSITRDVRDIAVSMAMYARYDFVVRNSPRLKEINDVRKQIHHRLTDKNYVNKFIETNYFKNTIIHYWKIYNNSYTHPNYMLVHYEGLINHPMPSLKHITNFLGMNIPAKRIRNILNKNNFKAKTNRNPGSENNKAFRRKGIAGDWKNYLNKESLEIIDRLLK